MINQKNHVEEAPQSPLEDDEVMEDLVGSPLEEHNDEDSSHISIEDQAQEEEPQIHEEAPYPPMEDLDEELEDESTHACISPPHEVEGLVSFRPSQISKFDDFPCYDLERIILKTNP